MKHVKNHMVTASRPGHVEGARWTGWIAAALLLALPFACDRTNPFPSGPTIAEVKATNAFIDISNRFGDKGLIHGWGGLAVFDYDNDGDLDIFVANGTGSANRLFRNDGTAHFVDVAAQAGVALPDDNCSACGIADLNNDGRLDLLLARQPSPGSTKGNVGTVLMLNEGSAGSGTSFRRIPATQSGLDTTAALCLGIGDLDNDGLTDILVGAHDLTILVPDLGPIYASQPNQLWRCTGLDGGVPTYEKVTTAKIEGTPQNGRSPETQDQAFVPGTFAMYLTDVDDDGRLDFFDLHDVPGGIDYFHNDGNMVFTRRQMALMNRTGGWMGMAGGDYDGDGDIDYFATNVGPDFRIVTPETSLFTSVVGPNSTRFHRLLMNDAGTLSDVAAETPISHSTVLPPQNSAQGQGLQAMEFAFGCAWIDADNRGKLDLYLVGDTVGDLGALSRILIPGVSLPVDAHGVGRFLHNNADGGFSDRTAERGLFNIPADGRISFGQNDAGRAVAACDLNGDGFRDLVVTNGTIVGTQTARLRVFLNPALTGNHWLSVRLRGTASNRFGIGARLRAFVGNRTYVNEVLTTTSCFTGVHPMAHFGLGSAQRIDKLTVRWPSGASTVLEDVAADQVITIVEQAP